MICKDNEKRAFITYNKKLTEQQSMHEQIARDIKQLARANDEES